MRVAIHRKLPGYGWLYTESYWDTGGYTQNLTGLWNWTGALKVFILIPWQVSVQIWHFNLDRCQFNLGIKLIPGAYNSWPTFKMLPKANLSAFKGSHLKEKNSLNIAWIGWTHPFYLGNLGSTFYGWIATFCKIRQNCVNLNIVGLLKCYRHLKFFHIPALLESLKC